MAMYTKDDLIDAYVASKRTSVQDVADWSARRLAALEQAFGVRLATAEGSKVRPLWMLFDATADSAAAITTPFASFLEAGLITKRLDESGVSGRRIDDVARELDQLARRSTDLHRRMLRELFDLLWDVDGPVSSEDLERHGFDDEEPRPHEVVLA